MAIARGNLAGIKQYSESIKHGREQLDNAMNQVKASIDSALQDISKEKVKADKVKETCAKGISKVSQKIDELKSKLNDLESELASTPPEIEIHYTDDDGNTHTITKPNPKYLQLLSEIAQVQEELQKYEELLSALNELSGKIDNQIETLEQSQKKIGDLKDKLSRVKNDSYYMFSSTLFKLKMIQNTISRYIDLKIETPNLSSVLKKNDHIGEVIEFRCRNQDLEGKKHPITGVPFTQEIIELEGQKCKVVVPKFESKFEVQLPDELLLKSDQEQIEFCDRMLEIELIHNSELESTFNDDQISQIMACTKIKGYSWHHSHKYGIMQLVEIDVHKGTAHTGGRNFWGGGTEKRK